MNAIEAKKFISICYYILLDREPDKKGVDYWVSRAVKEKMSETDIIYNFLNSVEYHQARSQRKVVNND